MSSADDLTCKEAAVELKTTVHQIRLMIRAGKLAAYDVSLGPGRPTWRIRRSAVAALKRAGTRRAA